MTNFKKIALGVLVAVLAFGFSAFKSEKVLIQENIYGLSSDGSTYTKIASDGQLPNDGTCSPNVLYEDCYVSFTDGNDPGADFPSSAIPVTAERSGTDGFWDN